MDSLELRVSEWHTIFHCLQGLSKGLSSFSGPSRVALIVSRRPDIPLAIYDPQELLAIHKKEIERYYSNKETWRNDLYGTQAVRGYMAKGLSPLNLDGLITRSYCSTWFFHQMWFTDLHSNMCSQGPTQSWLHSACDFLSLESFQWGKSFNYAPSHGIALQWNAEQAISKYIGSKFHSLLGKDVKLNVEAIIETLAGISTTLEEGHRAHGKIVFVQQNWLADLRFAAKFPVESTPKLQNWKHVRKLLATVEGTDLSLISEGTQVIGIADKKLAESDLCVNFRNGRGEVFLGSEPICSISDGRFYSRRLSPNLEPLQEIMGRIDVGANSRQRLFTIVGFIVDEAVNARHGCTIVLTFDEMATASHVSGQLVEGGIDLSHETGLKLSKSMSEVDGALYINPKGLLLAFGCILDGPKVQTENRSRGARFNSALRFSSANKDHIIVVVSEDSHLSIFHNGVNLTEPPSYPDMKIEFEAPTLSSWLCS